MAAERDSVAVTGIGVLSPIGENCAEFWDALSHGRHGARTVRRFSVSEYSSRVAGTLPGTHWDEVLGADGPIEGPDPVCEAATIAAREAWQGAGLESMAKHRVAVVLGTTAGGLWSRSKFEFSPREQTARRAKLLSRSLPALAAAVVADALGITGPRLTVSTACTSSTNALAHAYDLLNAGVVDAVLAGGVDLLVQEMFGGFYAMDAMTEGPCSPFSEPIGMTVGEGAGFVVLERVADARARGAKLRGAIHGYGLSLDAYHAITPDPSGGGVARAIASALSHAGIEAGSIGYINAHGTGTEANDPAEWRAIQRVFGARAKTIPVSSTKSYFGHALGAAGVLELVACAMTLEQGCIPPTLNFTRSRGGVPPDPVAQEAPRKHTYTYGAKMNSAFGGANAALVFGSVEHESRAISCEPRRAFVVGLSVLGAHGVDGYEAALREGKPLGAPDRPARVPPLHYEEHVRSIELRGMDSKGLMLTLTTARALQDAGIRLTGAMRDRVGLMVSAAAPSWDTADEFWASIRERGYPRLSASAFSRIVINACAGEVSRTLGVRGPVSVLAGGVGSTLASAMLSVQMLSTRSDVDALAVGSVHDFNEGDWASWGASAGNARFAGEGAVTAVLATQAPRAGGFAVEIAGYGCSGPGRLAAALGDALTMARCERAGIDGVYGSSGDDAEMTVAHGRMFLARDIVGATPASDAFALAAGIEGVRSGRFHGGGAARSVAVVSSDRLAGCFALVLRA